MNILDAYGMCEGVKTLFAPHLMKDAGFCFSDDPEGITRTMAKGQKRSSREVRKPKAAKPPASAAPSPLMNKGILTAINTPKRKG